MNILISVNKAYLEKVKTMIFSLRLNIKENIDVYLLNNSLSNEDVYDLFGYLKKKCKANLFEIKIDFTIFKDFPLCLERFSEEIYYRVLAQFILPEKLDRILWLDADLVVVGDITDFYYQDFEDKLLVVCPDSKFNSNWVSALKYKLNLPKQYIYFNSGVILFNLDELRVKTEKEDIIEIAKKISDKMEYPDQDILNCFYQNRVKYNDWKIYNHQMVLKDSFSDDEYEKVKIIHYTGPQKPWIVEYIKTTSRPYYKVRIKQGHLLNTIGNYLKYFRLFYFNRPYIKGRIRKIFGK